ncbi:AraC family transcriptional regulator [Gracilibacillus dipsosauri]|nr:AraC family transcriptional regulator [Gracilibacillus dipsosauri]
MFSINYRITGNPDLPKFHSHEDFEIFMFHKGICRYLINNQIYDLQPGDILLMDGLALHRPNVPDNCDYVRSNLHFIPDWIEPVLELMKAKELLDVFRFDHHYLIRTSNKEVLRDIEAIFEKMYKVEYSSRLIDSEKEWEMKFLLGELLVQINSLYRNTCLQAKKEPSNKTEHAEKIASYIQEHFTNKVIISEIAVALNLNKSYVSHVFKEMTGYTIMEYVMACRIQQAKYLLEAEETKQVQQIAYESGFENVSHFSRYFKEKLGITPKEYRKKRLRIYHSTNHFSSSILK